MAQSGPGEDGCPQRVGGRARRCQQPGRTTINSRTAAPCRRGPVSS